MPAPDLRSLFLLDPDVVFLNHGSFGATPKPIFDVYQMWQRRLEWQPVQFLVHDLTEHLADARQQLGAFINAPADDLVYVPNATFGVNVVAHSLSLRPGDEVLTTNHEYGACNNTWTYYSRKHGFRYVRQPIALPVTSDAEIIEAFWQGVTPRTKVIFLSHMSSSTAVTLPVAPICARAREMGILTVVDGAHMLGQSPLDMDAIGADFYTSNAHKWLCSPKGAAFLYVRPDVQHLVEPLVVGWGWGDEQTFTFGSSFLDTQQWLGTQDLAAYLSVPAAIQFQVDYGWTAVRQQCHDLLTETITRVCDLTGLHSIYGSDQFYSQMGVMPLPPLDGQALKQCLLDEFRVEAPVVDWNGRHFIRISVQGYNNQADLDILLHALGVLVPV
ncbi:MAG: aminotransferase class V-fold PLP-dependent enzyme [Chloroflexi bacterium]|nr:aminotransferase class V-fold PLP-dependent enzyme [Chloroflexota bacterium]